MVAGKGCKVKGVSLESFYAFLVRSLLEGEKPNASHCFCTFLQLFRLF